MCCDADKDEGPSADCMEWYAEDKVRNYLKEKARTIYPANTIYELRCPLPDYRGRKRCVVYSNSEMQDMPLMQNDKPIYVSENGSFLVGRYKT